MIHTVWHIIHVPLVIVIGVHLAWLPCNPSVLLLGTKDYVTSTSQISAPILYITLCTHSQVT